MTREPLCPYCRVPVIEHEDDPLPLMGIRVYYCPAAPVDEVALVGGPASEED